MRKSVITRILCFCLAVLFIIPLAAFTKNSNSKISRGNTKTALLLDDGAMTQEEAAEVTSPIDDSSPTHEEATEDASPIDDGALTQEEIIEDAYASLTEEDLFISEEVAINIAQLFISDSIGVGDMVSWDSSTEITDTVVMYDETGTDTVTAYSFELGYSKGYNGYIVVAARLDAPNLILEFADEAKPLYSEYDLDEDDQVVYLGTINYFMDSADSEPEALKDLYGEEVPRDEVVNVLEDNSDISNIPENVAIAIAAENEEAYFSESEAFIEESYIVQSESVGDKGEFALLSTDPAYGVEISNPISHANTYYAGPFVSKGDYINNWQNQAVYYKTSDFSGYYKHCAPTAITNLIKTYTNRYYNSSVSGKTKEQLFSTVAQVGKDHYYYTNSDGILGGTPKGVTAAYVYCVCEKFGIKFNLGPKYDATYANFKQELGKNYQNNLLLVDLTNHAKYTTHLVFCFAYTRLVSEKTGWYKSYIKVADGWASEGRYIDMASIANDYFWSFSLG